MYIATYSNHVGESGRASDVIVSATIQFRRATNTVAVSPMRGVHNERKTFELS